MFPRELAPLLRERLESFPAVVLLGARQVGKTTLAHIIAENWPGDVVFLDLESPADNLKLDDAEHFLGAQRGKLVVLDEVQRMPALFPVLRVIVDQRRREGGTTGQFLLLGSASPDLVRISESLAGRVSYLELPGLNALEVSAGSQDALDRLWLRGGFPESYGARNDAASMTWRQAFVMSYLQRDLPAFDARVPAETLRRLWTMLAHHQGGPLNAAGLAGSLGVSGPTVSRYVDLMTGLYLLRALRPWSVNVGKRLVKAPKIYLRDSGIAHALFGLRGLDELLGHPACGHSWEGFVIEQLTGVLPDGWTPWYYRTGAGAEIDLLLDDGRGRLHAIEIKRSTAPQVSKGFHLACEDVQAAQRLVVMPAGDSFPMKGGIEAVSLVEMMRRLKAGL